jgi:hypothetical protein
MTVWLMYYSLASLLLICNACGFLLNLVALPGNWIIVFGSAIFAWLVKAPDGGGISWPIVGVLLVLAILGEVAEFMAGMVGAAKYGASRRAMVLSVVGSIVGSIMGAACGMPVPIIGPAIAALLGGAIGAAAGAALGEDWKGRKLDDSLQVGAAAFWGRILGTTGKVIIGATMVVIATVDSLL